MTPAVAAGPLTLRGFGVSPGRRVGAVARMPDAPPAPSPEPSAAGTDPDAAAAAVQGAAARVRDALARAADAASGEAADILAVTAAMAADPSLVDEARRRIVETRSSPARAVWDAAELVAEQLRALGGMFADRARDVQDVRDRIIAELLGTRPPGIPDPGEPFVLVARDLAPADTARLDPSHVLAIVTEGGGPTAHTAILARSLGIPCVVAVAGALDLADGETVLVDGSSGEVVRHPSADAVASVAHAVSRPTRLAGPGRTADGHAVALLANVGDPAGAVAAAEAGAEGIGLFRTEFGYLGRTAPPGVDEQVDAYAQVFAAFPVGRVVIRTLDAGADKPLPFVTAAGEPNPALGVRGLRTSWVHPGILDDQLAAIAQAAASSSAQVWVMAPMVATAEEADAFVDRCAAHGLAQAGVMVEIPAAALRAGDLLDRARFASLGTNDLVQYAMAADRELASLAPLSTPWQPAVLSLVELACAGGRRRDRPVGVCGEAAADPALAPVLVGLGVSSLSMTARALPDVGAVLASVTLDACRSLAAVALASRTADEARAAVRAGLPVLAELGL
ncbi:phosphoenolpyruvate--protein phosphotransferase [Cellulomonas fengjieae]|uniref:Phosphoenolpyruvate-protein phosphotransferase n=1 Tax=Cellulomonas fengjieae TaxID=2819978 RepID=A0ABS3SHF3_9CELL|nr:phosphoenolpyruvate--protein phosphotransferase [Cellulomonas fengjieae]MBO3085182.1 phosphoenolpyruvate--protein phosphotransferase [Cellulomonas fengjieae]QVI66246.1 phosphoenolpyruvate--protein phosphotransferase [Cellulomonas fengjieae]